MHYFEVDNFSGEGSPDSNPIGEGPLPKPYPLGAYGASILAPSGLVPPFQNPGSAPERTDTKTHQ